MVNCDQGNRLKSQIFLWFNLTLGSGWLVLVSLLTIFIFGIDLTSGGRPSGQSSATSARALACHSGCRASNMRHQDDVRAVVSWPAKYMFLQLSTMKLSGSVYVSSLPALRRTACSRLCFKLPRPSSSPLPPSFTVLKMRLLISLFILHASWARLVGRHLCLMHLSF